MAIGSSRDRCTVVASQDGSLNAPWVTAKSDEVARDGILRGVPGTTDTKFRRKINEKVKNLMVTHII